MPDGFISPEYELPLSDGLYEVWDMLGRVAVTLFDVSRSAFLPAPGIVGVKGWREYIPDEEDIAEYRERGCDEVLWI